jgi:hypothetical protein
MVRALSVGQAVVFYAAVAVSYAHRDDYIAMQFHSIDFDWLHSVYAMDGRMLLGLLNGLFFDHTTTVESLTSIRLAGLVGGMLLSLTLLGILRQARLGDGASLVGAMAGGLTLASVVYVGWTICFALYFAPILNLAAGILFGKVIHGNARQLTGITLLAGLLFVAGTLIYQGTTPMFLVPAFFSLLQEERTKGAVLRMGLFLRAFALYSVAYLVVFKGYSALLFEVNPRAGRVLSEIDLPAILGNLRRLSVMTLNRNVATPSVLVPCLAAAGIISFLLFQGRGLVHRLLLLLGLLTVILAGFTPSLSSSNQMSDFRTFIASQVVALTTAGIGWHCLLQWILARLRVPCRLT